MPYVPLCWNAVPELHATRTPMDLSLHEELRKERTFAICGLPAEQLYIPMEELWKQDLEQKNPDNTLTKFIKQQHDRHDKEHGKPTTALRQAILKVRCHTDDDDHVIRSAELDGWHACGWEDPRSQGSLWPHS
jgi:hypothetical protein